MRRLIYCLAAFAVLVLSHHAARAGVAVRIDKLAQRMIVSVDGQPAYVWPVWFSTKYYGSPMPHSIFFHKGYAIHGTNYISRLGGPASHGCVRLHPANAAKLFALVQRAGLANTSIVISGADPVLAKRRARSAQATY
jgi:hypothetical protein